MSRLPATRALLLFGLLSASMGSPVLRGQAGAVPDFPRTAPTPQAQAVQTLQAQRGFTLRLLAAEPLIADPVDVAYDEDGRAYVVEMRDYPYPEEKGAAPREFPGQVALLEDRNGDGIFDVRRNFADQLSWPTSVACWKGGVFVAAAPDIWYFRDEDGDGRADTRRRVFTGFSRDNVQAIMNGLRWGLDNRIYGAASGNGGSIVPADQKGARPISVTRGDFRFDPATDGLEAIPGGARFGNAFDDWGNRFVCNIRNPVQQVILSERYLARNPRVTAPPVIHDVAESGDQVLVYRQSPPEPWRVFRAQRWAAERINFPRSELLGAGYWTSSSGVAIYRGSAYPPEFHGNAFVAEVAGNVVHRQVLEPAGVTFRSQRGDPGVEFVASTDIWFRPVNFVNAPDGTLHVLDMYRETIEHPWSIPDDIKAKLDLRSGNDRGRLYRLEPPGYTSPAPPRLSTASPAQLVELLAHPNAWHRETAQRLLVERQPVEAVREALRRQARESSAPLGRLHSLYTLAGLHEGKATCLDEPTLLAALSDQHPQLRRHAARLAETAGRTFSKVRARVAQLADDPEPVVRFQVALTLGVLAEQQDFAAEPWVGALARIAARDAADEWQATAVLCSAATQPQAVLQEFLSAPRSSAVAGQVRLVRELTSQAVAKRGTSAAVELLEVLNRLPATESSLAMALVTGLGLGLERHQQNLDGLISAAPAATGGRLRAVREASTQQIRQRQGTLEARLAAVELARFASLPVALELLTPLLDAAEPVPLQLAAVRLLRLRTGATVSQALIAQWRLSSAATRQEICEALLSRPEWTVALLDALEQDQIAAGQLAIPQRGRLVNSTTPAIQQRATKLLGPAATSARSEVVQRFQAALNLVPDRANGEKVYRRECQTCHRLGATGHDVGPNLNTIRHRSSAEILVHVFDPNRDVPPQFIAHNIQLKDGRVLSGAIAAEDDTTLVLIRAENARDTVPRYEIEQVVSTGKSLMPEGLEQKLTPQEVADLIGYLLAK